MAGRLITILTMCAVVAAGCADPEPGPIARPIDHSRAKSQHDAAALDEALVTLEAWHDSLGTGRVTVPGPAAEDVLATFEDLTFTLNDELRAIWTRDAGAPEAFVLEYALLGATAARERFDSLRARPELEWRPTWIPVLESDRGWLVVESSRSEAPAGPVLHVGPDGTAAVAFTNLKSLFTVFADAVDDSVATWGGDRMVLDPVELRARHGAANPGLELANGVTGS